MNGRSIVYIEDEEDYQILVRRILGKEGYQVHTAPSSEAGRLALERFNPGLLILDVNLQDTDGYSLCRELRQHPEWTTLPILMLTVRRRPDEWLRGFAAGADDYVAKPLNPPDLVERVRSCLTSKLPFREKPGPYDAAAEYLLIRAAVGGNRNAYEVLIEKYKPRLMGSLRASGKSVQDAEDLAAAAFVRAYECLDQFRGQASFYTWLYRIAFNCRQRRLSLVDSSSSELLTKQDEAFSASLAVSDGVSEHLNRQGLHAKIHDAVSVVPRPYREMLTWHFVRGLSYQTIAQRLRIPEGTVMSRLFKARQLLRKSWNRVGGV